MAEKEKPVADNETGKIKIKAKKEKQPKKMETKSDVDTVKAKMTAPAEVLDDNIIKVDLDKPINQEKNEQPQENKENNVDDSGVVAESEKVQQETETQETPVLEEVTKEELVENTVEEVQEAVAKAEETGQPLPENVQKLVDFIQETGGDINDYVTLNQDYSNMDNQTLLYEYYKQTKPHLSNDEIDFIMEDQFAYNEEDDTEKEIKRKKLAMKEQVASAKQHLESVKSKYYENIKAGSKLTKEQQKAVDFFNRYNEESEFNKKQVGIFENKTNQVFNDKFKGFEYNIGDKKFRFNVKDANKIKETQSDINNFIKKFLNKENSMEDAAGYHKGLFTAMNPDQIANHFYEQGKADALKESIAKSKNVSMDPRQSHSDNVNTSGFTVRALNDDSSDFKFKIKNKNK